MLTDVQIETLLERLKADRDFHAAESARITRESLDVDAGVEYSAEADTEESYHAGRVEALQNVIEILLGHEVELYSETFAEIAGPNGPW